MRRYVEVSFKRGEQLDERRYTYASKIAGLKIGDAVEVARGGMDMNNYIIADSPVSSYNKVICLLDYKVGITAYLENINNNVVFNNRIIVDTLLVSGSTPYRFIGLDINKDGRLDLSSYKYVDLDDDMVYEFNKLIKDEANWVRNSILTPKQKDRLLSLR